MYGYIYETTNLINGKKYIGKKASKKFIKDYYGSGTNIVKALNKYGKENFSIRILEEIPDDKNNDYLSDRECYYIEKYNAVNDKNYYNISYGHENNWVGYNKNKEFKKQVIVKSNKKRKLSEESINKMKNSLNKYWTKERRLEHGKKIHNYYKGDNLSNTEIQERHNKLSNIRKGNIPWNKGLTKETDKRVAKYGDKLKSRQFSKETRKKMSDAQKHKIVSKETREKLSKSNKGKKPSRSTIDAIKLKNRKSIFYNNIIYNSIDEFCYKHNITRSQYYKKYKDKVIYLNG